MPRGVATRYHDPMSASLLRIGELAERSATSADSIRHYERLGLLPPPIRTGGGYRLFPPAALDRVRLIRSAVRVGFSLKQLAAFLQQRDVGQAPCRKVRAAAADILAAVDRQIAELEDSRRALRAMLHEWDSRLAATAGNQPARLLDALPASAGPSTGAARPNGLRRSR